ncbi:hypothetical protein N7541_002485 [Penicillium brevicompactum]|uniref:Uncharacterized protein n=1 Tax=Penicillium brevicompactum TaxID=5074 RepID=A0A9W9RKE7_PENBR|nr:hypothetical protein N7541_002485 [Penicillium brevicompactum]
MESERQDPLGVQQNPRYMRTYPKTRSTGVFPLSSQGAQSRKTPPQEPRSQDLEKSLEKVLSAVDVVEAHLAKISDIVDPNASKWPTRQPTQYPFRFRNPEADSSDSRGQFGDTCKEVDQQMERLKSWTPQTNPSNLNISPDDGLITSVEKLKGAFEKSHNEWVKQVKSQDDLIQCLLDAHFMVGEQLSRMNAHLQSLEQRHYQLGDKLRDADYELEESDTEVRSEGSHSFEFVACSGMDEEEDEGMEKKADKLHQQASADVWGQI